MKQKLNYTGIALIVLSVGIILCFMSFIGYNTYIVFSKEKIEVQAENSNSAI